MTDKVAIEKLNRSIDVCNLHISRLNYAITQVEKLIPISVESFSNLNNNDIQSIDQFIYRFIKLQDELGNKTFKNLLIALKEDVSDKPFADILSLLEKFGIIEDEDQWMLFRQLRNELTHEYPGNISDNIKGINSLYNHISEIKAILENILVLSEKYKLIIA